MLCEACQQREAMVHLTTTVFAQGLDQPPGSEGEQHFCEECADEYFARTPGMNSSRGLICLSDRYRSKLYDLLEATHPEAFDNEDTEACQRASDLMQKFLRKNLSEARIEVNDDVFEMLCADFFCSHHFYTRADEYKKKKG